MVCYTNVMRLNAKRLNRKRLLITGLVLSFILIIGLVYAVLGRSDSVNERSESASLNATPTPTPSSTTIKISAMGDMLPHDTIVSNAKTDSGYDFAKYFANVRPSYQDSDIVFCNQEGLSAGDSYGITGYPAFNAPTQFAEGLHSGAGCNVINLANNHIGDKTQSAIDATLDLWQTLNPLAVSGANKSLNDQQTIKTFTVKGVKFAFVAFADFNNSTTTSYGVNIYHDQTLFKSLLKKARESADVVIVSMHWGVEGSGAIDNDQRAQVTTLANEGADIVFGTGPHVLQPLEARTRPDGKNMYVWYSLGNMLSSQLNIDELIGGIAGLTVTKTSDGIKIDTPTFIPTYMHYEWTAAQKAANNLSSRKNAMIYLLKDAAEPLSRSLLRTSVDSQIEYVKSTLGDLVVIK